MFVLVVDTSLMNVSISAVVRDLDTTVSSVQSAIALEALVSAAFILIGSKVGDLFGRKRAYVLGLLGYAVGAVSMALAQGAHRDHRLLGGDRRPRRVAAAAVDAVPDPRQLRGGGAEEGLRPGRGLGRDRRRGRAAARRLHHDLPVVARRVPARGRRHRRRAVRHQAGPRRALHRLAPRRPGRRGALGPRHGRRRPRDPRVAGGRRVRGGAAGAGAMALGGLVYWLARRKRRGRADADRPRPVPLDSTSGPGSRGSCSSRSPSAAR